MISAFQCSHEMADGTPLVCKLKDVSVRGDPSVLFISIDGQEMVLAESFNYDHTAEKLRKLCRKPADCPAAAGDWMALNSVWCKNIWHWITESLPKVLLAESAGFNGRYLVPNRPFVIESLELLGIDMARVVPADKTCRRAEVLYVVARMQGADLCRTLLGEELRSKLLSAVGESSDEERVYIARGGAKRTITNEAETDSLLAGYGFRKVFMEDLSFREQIELMRGCRVLVLPHGAGAVHMLFMPPESLVIELFSPTYINPTMLPVVRHLRHRYFMVPSRWCPPGEPKPYTHGKDIEACLEAIDVILTRELATS